MVGSNQKLRIFRKKSHTIKNSHALITVVFSLSLAEWTLFGLFIFNSLTSTMLKMKWERERIAPKKKKQNERPTAQSNRIPLALPVSLNARLFVCMICRLWQFVVDASRCHCSNRMKWSMKLRQSFGVIIFLPLICHRRAIFIFISTNNTQTTYKCESISIFFGWLLPNLTHISPKLRIRFKNVQFSYY